LPDEIVKGLDSHVILFEGEDPADFPWREAPDLGNHDLDDEVSTRSEVRRRIGNDCELLILSGHVHDGVPDQVHEPEGSWYSSCRHIPDGHGHMIGPVLGAQLLHHVRRQLDSRDTYPPILQRQSDASGADCKLERVPSVRELRQKINSRVENQGVEHHARRCVVNLRHISSPNDCRHTPILA